MLDNINEKKNYIILSLALFLYVLVIIWVVIFKLGIPTLILEYGSVEPPYSFGEYVSDYLKLSLNERLSWAFTHPFGTYKSAILDYITNILTFLPLGLVLAAMIKKYNVIYSTLIGFTFSFIVETFQLFTLFGRCDVYDLIFNIVGTLIGALLYVLLVKIIPKNKINLVINIVGIVTIIIMIGMLIYAIISIVNARDVINFKWCEVQKFNKW